MRSHEACFADRTEAGQALAHALLSHANKGPFHILALPRGGVPIGLEIARTLHASFGVCCVRKLGAPNQPELAIGAIALYGDHRSLMWNQELIDDLHVSSEQMNAILEKESQELLRRSKLYPSGLPASSVKNKTVILVDDGIATGMTMEAAISVLCDVGVSHIIVATPVVSEQESFVLAKKVDALVCVKRPRYLSCVGSWYGLFPQLSDEEVLGLLATYSNETKA